VRGVNAKRVRAEPYTYGLPGSKLDGMLTAQLEWALHVFPRSDSSFVLAHTTI